MSGTPGGNKKKIYDVGDLVFAKVRGYPIWPARINALMGAKGNRYNVFFFGTYESGNVKREDLWEFNANTKVKYGEIKSSLKRKGFAEGMYEIQNTPDLQCANPAAPIDEAAALAQPLPEGGDELLETSAAAPAVHEGEEEEGEVPEPLAAPSEQPGEAPEAEGDTPGLSANAQALAFNEDSAMEDDEDEGALVVSEAPVKKNNTTPANNPSRKRKAADETPITAPPTKKKPAPNITPATPATPATAGSAVAAADPSAGGTPAVSRSGRVIKPKKFVDDDIDNKAETEKSPLTKTAKTPKAKDANKEPRKMWVEVKATGDIIEINLDLDKPDSFESAEAELQWDKASARSALKFKQRVESGEFIPDEVREKLEAKLNRTEEEEGILKKAKQISLRMEKIRWLKIEQRIIDIDISLKKAVNIDTTPDIDKALKSMSEFDEMAVAPLMLKKQPDIVNTIRKLRRYVGPVNSEKEFAPESEKIRNRAETLYSKLKDLFQVGSTPFNDVFQSQLSEFKNATKSMPEEQVLSLVADPTKKSSTSSSSKKKVK